MRLINKTTICAAALGLLLLYIIRKRKTADEQPVSDSDAASAYANVAEAAPVVSAPSATHTPADAPVDIAPPSDDSPDTQADTGVAAHPDISVYEDAFEQEDAALDEPLPGDSVHDTQADGALDEPPPADDTHDTQADAAQAEPPPASEVPPKSLASPQRKPSAQPPPKRQRQPAATRTQPKRQRRPAASAQSTRQSKPRRHMGRRVRKGVYYAPLSPPTERASLRCRETSEGWEIYLAIPQESAVVKVTHGGDELQVASETELPLSQFAGDVAVHYQDNTARLTLFNAADGKPLFFKMRENWEGEGRLVNNPTAGHILAIAPLDYDASEWDDYESNEPEECVDENFEARFLFLEGAAPGRPARMRIKGKALHDDADAEYHGKLYIGAPPELHVDPQITDARIVEETGGRKDNEWGENFAPHRQSIAAMLDGRDGRFSIRTYHDGDLQESKPFRYFPTLRRIAINGNQHSPGTALMPDTRAGTHREIALRFELDSGACLRPYSVSHDNEVHIDDDDVVIIPPSPSIQTLTCDFPNRAAIAVAVPRVWWRLTDEDGATGEWGGETYEFSRNEFMNLIKARIEISAPPAIKAVEVGFSDDAMNERKASQGAVEFGLMVFADYKEVFDALDKTLHLNIRVNGQTAPILRVLADTALDESAADKALLNLRDRYTARAMPSASPRDRSTPSTDGWARGAHDVRLERMKRPDTLKEGESVFGDVVQIAQGSHLVLEITVKSSHSFHGILEWSEMKTMPKTERAEITIGQKLPVYVIKAPPGRRARLSVDRLTDENHNAAEN